MVSTTWWLYWPGVPADALARAMLGPLNGPTTTNTPIGRDSNCFVQHRGSCSLPLNTQCVQRSVSKKQAAGLGQESDGGQSWCLKQLRAWPNPIPQTGRKRFVASGRVSCDPSKTSCFVYSGLLVTGRAGGGFAGKQHGWRGACKLYSHWTTTDLITSDSLG